MAHSRSIVWLCVTFCSTVGGFVPELWGQGGFSAAALVFSVVGCGAGLWLGLRLAAD